ncbi:hypothetical protein ACSX1A_00240 [Pontibacter sp. MBLB2868]|uniref:hypothetical protein n=1 Tax=Pontibacter sp. MBLB2868 TaxID=3451555 RepID=UPI003F74DCF9
MPIPRHIIHRCRYSLAVRLLVLLLLVNSFAAACTSDSASEEQNDVPEEHETALEPDTTSTRRNSIASATFSVLSNPFVENRSKSNHLESYFDRINADFTLDADPIENRHKSQVTDTVYTIRFGKSMIEFYAPTQSGELLLQVADIQSNDVVLRHNMRVGMTQAELMGKLKSLGHEVVINQTPTEIVAYNRDGAPISLHFYLKSGKVNRIRYEGYVD